MLDSISESIDIWSQGQLHLYLREAEEKEPDLVVLQNLDRLLSGEGGSFGGNRVSRASLAVGLYLHALYMPLIDSQLFQSPSPPVYPQRLFYFPQMSRDSSLAMSATVSCSCDSLGYGTLVLLECSLCWSEHYFHFHFHYFHFGHFSLRDLYWSQIWDQIDKMTKRTILQYIKNARTIKVEQRQ